MKKHSINQIRQHHQNIQCLFQNSLALVKCILNNPCWLMDNKKQQRRRNNNLSDETINGDSHVMVL